MPPKIEKGFDPIQQRFRENMQAAFGALVEIFPDIGLCLFLFSPDAANPRANYISNTDRSQTLAAIKEWVARQEAASAEIQQEPK